MKRQHSMASVGLTVFAAIFFVAGNALVFLGAVLKIDNSPNANWLFAGGLLAIFLSLFVYIASVVTPVLRNTLGKGRMPGRAPEVETAEEEGLELRELKLEKERNWKEEDLV